MHPPRKITLPLRSPSFTSRRSRRTALHQAILFPLHTIPKFRAGIYTHRIPHAIHALLRIVSVDQFSIVPTRFRFRLTARRIFSPDPSVLYILQSSFRQSLYTSSIYIHLDPDLHAFLPYPLSPDPAPLAVPLPTPVRIPASAPIWHL